LLFHIGVDLGKMKLALILVGEFCQQRHQHLAGGALPRPEIGQYRYFVRVLNDPLIEIIDADPGDGG
jgi:hypothetical protein